MLKHCSLQPSISISTLQNNQPFAVKVLLFLNCTFILAANLIVMTLNAVAHQNMHICGHTHATSRSKHTGRTGNLKHRSGISSSRQCHTSASPDTPTRVAGRFRLSRSSPAERWRRRGSGSRSCTPPPAQL